MADEEKKKQQKKKIIIDEDWKQQAQREKEILAAQEEAEKKKAQPRQRGPLPKGDFAGLLSMLYSQTLYSLGLLQAEGQEKPQPDLELARYNIDMLETLQDKTKGNLSPQEETVLKNMLNEVRMAYVKVAE